MMMQIPDTIPTWDGSTQDAIKLQREIAQRVEREDRLGEVHHIAGIDVSANSYTGLARAAVVIVAFPDLREVEVARAELPLAMDYIPGLLSFRETPVILEAVKQLHQSPDLLMVDGQGIAHPRRCGIASHLGVLLDMPSIGCAKSILRGKHEPLPDEVGTRAEMVDHGEVVGMALRTRRHANPLYISIGNRVSLTTAVSYVERCLRGYRLPEPTRLAHLRAGTAAT
jgi:deoxyribonuclease V